MFGVLLTLKLNPVVVVETSKIKKPVEEEKPIVDFLDVVVVTESWNNVDRVWFDVFEPV